MISQTTIQDVLRGFDNGETFASEGEIREYFTRESYDAMFGQCIWTQEELDAAARYVIDNRLHCDF